MSLIHPARRFLPSLVITLMAVAMWQILAASQLVSPLLLPGPIEVLAAFGETYPAVLLHTAATLARALTGLMLGSLLGIALGLCMTVNDRWYAILDPIVENMRPVPAIAAIPFFILWFGTGSFSQILLTTLSCGVVLAVDVFHAVRAVPPVIIRAARSLGARSTVLYQDIILPAILPALTPGLRIIVALSFSIAVASEFMGAQWGLGFMIMRARRTLETQTILMSMLIIGFLARATDLFIRELMARLTVWVEFSTDSARKH